MGDNFVNKILSKLNEVSQSNLPFLNYTNTSYNGSTSFNVSHYNQNSTMNGINGISMN